MKRDRKAEEGKCCSKNTFTALYFDHADLNADFAVSSFSISILLFSSVEPMSSVRREHQ
jgi:hypothetical protein